MAVRDLPEQINFLDASYHQMAVARLPMTVFTLQEATVPDVRLKAVTTGNPFIKLNFAGDHIDLTDFSCRFIVDEQMQNYREIYDWIRGLGFPESYEQYNDLVRDDSNVGGIRSDIALVVSNSSKLAKLQFTFKECIPTSLSNLTFVTTNGKPNYVLATATFSVRDFEVETVVP